MPDTHDMTDPHDRRNDPETILTTTRVIWAFLLMGQIIFLVVAAVFVTQKKLPSNAVVGWILFVTAGAMLPMSVGLGYFIRMQIYKRNWLENRIAPPAYLQGNIVLFALCEAVSLVSILSALISGQFFPALIPGVLAMAVQVLNFPNGKPMQPAADPFSPQSTSKSL